MKKRIAIIVFCLGITLTANTIQIGNRTGNNGDTVHIPIELINEDRVGGLQFDLSFDGNFLTALNFTLTPRTAGFTIASSIQTTSIRIMLYSTSGDAISASSGDIAEISFIISQTAIKGDTIPLQCKQILLSSTTGTLLTVQGIDGFVNVKEPAPASINLLTIVDDSAHIRDTIDVVVNLINEDSVGGMQILIDYDTTIFTYYKVGVNSRTAGFTCVGTQLHNQLTIMVYSASGLTIPPDSGGVVVIKLIVNSHAINNQAYEISFRKALLASFQGSELPVTWTNGSIYILPGVSITEFPELVDKKIIVKSFPNPFTTQTILEYVMGKGDRVSLKIVDLSGRQIRTLINNDYKKSGTYSIMWDGKDDYKKNLPSGHYFAIFRLSDVAISRKLVLIK